MTTTILNTKNWGVENKNPNTSRWMTVTVLNTKTGGVENKFPDHDKYNITSEFDKFYGFSIWEDN